LDRLFFGLLSVFWLALVDDLAYDGSERDANDMIFALLSVLPCALTVKSRARTGALSYAR
jgi:hypothetical protein